MRPRGASRCSTIWLTLGGVLIVAGFLGLDRWFYTHVSLRLETPTLGDRDFYALTRPLWWLVRGAFAHVVGLAVIGVGLLVWQPERWKATVRAAALVAAAAVLANVLQAAIGRVRPNRAETHLAFVAPFSQLWTKQEVCFPSGEAATAFALAAALTHRHPRGRWWWYVAATLAAAARLVNGAHYLSDVAAGATLGWGVVTILTRGRQSLIAAVHTEDGR
jgi:membrane-associated phospholipid phosphatase